MATHKYTFGCISPATMVRRQDLRLPDVRKEPGLHNLERAHRWSHHICIKMNLVLEGLQMLHEAYAVHYNEDLYSEEFRAFEVVRDVDTCPYFCTERQKEAAGDCAAVEKHVHRPWFGEQLMGSLHHRFFG